jgi:hypothetical protein
LLAWHQVEDLNVSFIFAFTFGPTWYVFMCVPAKQKIHQNLWKLLVQSPISRFGVVF